MMTTMGNVDTVVRGRGRPRDELARQRILDAALAELEASGYANATVEAIADRACAGKATVYRWWPNKAAVFIEAFREDVAPELPFPDTGCFRLDILTQLQNFTRMLSGRRGRLLAAFVTAAQSDPEVSSALWSLWVKPRRDQAKKALIRNQARGELRADVDPDLVLDILYGPLYYRLLMGGQDLTLSQSYAERLTDLALNGLLPARR
jgi:AcrR family transcriptional regulator